MENWFWVNFFGSFLVLVIVIGGPVFIIYALIRMK